MKDNNAPFTAVISESGAQYMTSPNIPVTHGFTTRLGGVSGGIYSSLNLREHCGDSRENIAENYRRIASALGVSTLCFTRQVHKNTVRTVTAKDAHTLFEPVPYEADGLITEDPNCALVIFTADCIPILLWDREKNAVGALHAGWRGTAADIAGVGISRMIEEFGSEPKNIFAAIGPGIGQCCFETGCDVPEAMAKTLPNAMDFVKPGKVSGKFMVDLKGINRALLIRAGVPAENISVSDECTMCLHDKYWSHRFTGGERGSQASIIAAKGLA